MEEVRIIIKGVEVRFILQISLCQVWNMMGVNLPKKRRNIKEVMTSCFNCDPRGDEKPWN